MVNLGLAGHAGCGKDTVANYLAKRYGFIVYSFSDELYREVIAAFGLDRALPIVGFEDDNTPVRLDSQAFLRDRATKDTPSMCLALANCNDADFIHAARPMVAAAYPDTFSPLDEYPLSPRQVLQWWGTEYRRAQDPDYWIKKADEWLFKVWQGAAYPEQQPQFFVNTSVRFPNERDWIHKFSSGNVWHIFRSSRDGLVHDAAANHTSETPLPVLEGERELHNNDTLDRLYRGVDLLLNTAAKFVKVEPMAPYQEEA